MSIDPRVESLFHQALDCASDSRGQFLDGATSGDRALREEIEALLRAHDSASGFLASPVLVSALDDADDQIIGAVVGGYRLTASLGAGGMGRVYLGEREGAPFHQRAAVKLIYGAVGDRDRLRRFRTECEALARVEHPNVARLIDGGVTDAGLPYLVMEYVDGEPIDRYCERAGLALRERLALFADVCAAVHHVHQHATVHRDLKPSNILVDHEGRARLVDFGIARLLDAAGEAAGNDRTATGFQVLTPQYASPEQVRGEPVSTASDVYSLGVVLCKLLTGRLPHDLADLSGAEMRRVVTEVAPRRPSQAAALAGDRKLARKLRGDLDTIVLMALRKEPERRYPSAERLAEDVRDHLSGRPVRAQPDSVRYRLGKFIRRNPAASAIGAALGVVLVTSSVTGFALYRRAERERGAAVEHAQTAERVTEFLAGLFRGSSPEEARGETLSARDLLARGVTQVERDTAMAPAVRARLLETLGDVHQRLGLLSEARPLLERAVAVRRAAGDPVATAAALSRVAGLYQATDQYEAARRALDEARSVQTVALGPDHPDLANTLNALGVVMMRLGLLDSARAHLERAVAIYQRARGPDDRALVEPVNNLARTLQGQGDLAGSLPLMQRALAILERTTEPNHPDRARAHNNLGAAFFRLGRYAEARPHLEQSLAAAEATLGPEHPQVGTMLNNVAMLRRRLGDMAGARAALDRALAIAERTLGADHHQVAQRLINLASLDLEQGAAAAAQDRIERAVAIFERRLGPNHPELAQALQNLGGVLLERGAPAPARTALERARAIFVADAADHPGVATTDMVLAALDRRAGNWDAAARRLAVACPLLERKLAAGSEHRARCLTDRALVQARLGDTAAADSGLADGIAAFAQGLGAEHPDRWYREARHWVARGDPDRALGLLRRAVDAGYSRVRLARDVELAALTHRQEFQDLIR